MLGLIKLPHVAHPDVSPSLEAAVEKTIRIDDLKPRNLREFYLGLPRSWGPFLNFLVDNHLQRRDARREPYLHSRIEEVDRTRRTWLRLRFRYELTARTVLYRIRAANLTSAVVWNGQVNGGALVAGALRELGIPTLYAELSPFKCRYFLDYQGVNAASSLQAAKPEGLPVYEDEDQLFDTLKNNYLGRRVSSGALNDPTSLPRAFVFAPLQVPTDTQIMLHGGAVQSQCEYIDMLRVLAAERMPSGVILVVKPHPVSPYSASYLQDTIGKNVFIATNFETRDLLERCKAIVTVNSSVGLDGFLFDKPIVAVGNAPWVKPALAAQAKNVGDIGQLIANPPVFDMALRKRFIAHWYHAYTWDSADSPRRTGEFVEAKLAAARLHAGAAKSDRTQSTKRVSLGGAVHTGREF